MFYRKYIYHAQYLNVWFHSSFIKYSGILPSFSVTRSLLLSILLPISSQMVNLPERFIQKTCSLITLSQSMHNSCLEHPIETHIKIHRNKCRLSSFKNLTVLHWGKLIGVQYHNVLLFGYGRDRFQVWKILRRESETLGKQESYSFSRLSKVNRWSVLGCAWLRECCENSMYSKWDAS